MERDATRKDRARKEEVIFVLCESERDIFLVLAGKRCVAVDEKGC